MASSQTAKTDRQASSGGIMAGKGGFGFRIKQLRTVAQATVGKED